MEPIWWIVIILTMAIAVGGVLYFYNKDQQGR